MSSAKLTPQNGFIFRIIHLNNLEWILQHGMHCSNAELRSPFYRAIGNPDIIIKRQSRVIQVSPFGTLADYIPFYFTPYSPMLLNIQTGFAGIIKVPPEEIIIFVSKIDCLMKLRLPFLFTDRHAYLANAQFYNNVDLLSSVIDWTILQNRDFKRDPENPEKTERYQAETLIYKHVPVDAFVGIISYNDRIKERIQSCCARYNHSIPVHATTGWYF